MLFKEGLLHAGSHLGYFSGISMMLPVLGTAWERHIAPWMASPYAFYAAAGLILLSFILIGKIAGSFSGMLKGIGWMTLIPGVLALIFSAVGQENVFNLATKHITGFAVVEPAATWFVHHSVPTTTLGGFYILIGVGLVWAGRRLEGLAGRI
jgi:hypothetical protein